MSLLSYIIWQASPEFFSFPDFLPVMGGREVRYYGLLFALGFLISQQVLFYIFRKEGKPEQDVETLTIYMIIATIIGARLGHVFFYEPEKYLADPVSIFKIWEGGLASHGAAIGIFFALWLYANYHIELKKFVFKKRKKPGQGYLQVLDRIAIVVALTGCLIRFGNFMNSEIYGVPTQSNYGVVFAHNVDRYFSDESSPIADISYEKDNTREGSQQGYRPLKMSLYFKNQPEILNEKSIKIYLDGRFKSILTDYEQPREQIYTPEDKPINYILTQQTDGTYLAVLNVFAIPRHPTQLYESFTSLLLFILLFLLWKRGKENTAPGLLFGLFLSLLFSLRFAHELFKENQVAFENSMALNMGQILSIPLIIVGIIIFIRALRKG